MKPSEVPAEAVQAVAEILYRAYDAEFVADHLSWRDFRGQARDLIVAAVPHIREQVAQEILDAQAEREQRYVPPGRPDALGRWHGERKGMQRAAEIARNARGGS
jgi:hypothetical protein